MTDSRARGRSLKQNQRQYSNYFYDLKQCGLVDAEDDEEEFEREVKKDEGGGLADFVFEELEDSRTGGIQPGGKKINAMTKKDID